MIHKAILILIPMFLAASALAGVQTLTLKDGPKYTGEVTKTNTGYQIKLPTGDLVEYTKAQVKSVEAAADPSEEYKARLAKIDASKADGHYDIGKWAQSGDYLDIAYKEFSDAYKLDPESEKIKTRLQGVMDQIDALTKAGTKGEATTKPEDTVSTIPGLTYMSDEDIYRIRMYELTDSELKATPPGIEWKDKKLFDRFIDQMRADGVKKFTRDEARNEFLALPNPQKLLVMRKNLQANDPMLDDVLIKTDPRFMKEFRTQVWPVVRGSCASVECHGSPKGKGGLILINGKNPRLDYSNFWTLTRWFKGDNCIVNMRLTGDSMLLQYGLPQALAKNGLKHPNVLKRLSPYHDTADPKYRMVLEWIKSLQGTDRPSCKVKWAPPVGVDHMGEPPNWITDDPTTTGPSSKPADSKESSASDPLTK